MVDRELLFCAVAGALGLADEPALQDVALRVQRGETAHPRQDLVERAGLTRPGVAQVDAAVEEHLAVHGGSAAAALKAFAAVQTGDGTLSLAGWWVRRCLDTGLSTGPDPGAPDTVPAVEDAQAITPECPGRYAFPGGNRFGAEIGRGGLGRVLVALDRHLGREVAVKELLAGGELGTAAGGGPSAPTAPAGVRFLREARVTGQLEHPNIVPVHELGVRSDGTLYYTMRRVHGRTLAQALRACSDLRDRLKLLSHFADVCHAVAYAHSRGVIHRDLKAENVMIGEFGETVVLDWGLAKVAGARDIREHDLEHDGELLRAAAAGLTVEGTLLGTPDHMSPEQARGALDEVDERTDVWALGTVLYEILTGRRLFLAPSPLEVIRKVLHEPVVPPRGVDPAVPSELESVCLKALAREKSDRYASAGELAREIESYQSGEKVVAHEYSAWEHLRRFAAKKRPVIVAAVVVAAVTVGALAGVTRAFTREKTARAREAEQRLLAEYHLSEALQEKAARLGRSGTYLSAGVYAAASLLHNPAYPRAPEYRAGFERAHPEAAKLAVEAGSWAWVSGLRAAFTHQRTIVAGQAVCGVAISRDGAMVAGAACDAGAWVWDASTGATLLSLPGGAGGTTAVTFAPDGGTLATASQDGVVRLWSLADGTLRSSLGGRGAALTDLEYSGNGAELAAASRDGTVVLWDPAGGRKLRTLAASEGVIHSISFASRAERIAAGGRDARVRLWDTRSGRLLRTFAGHAGVVRGVAISPDGSRLASASYDRTARVWNAGDGRLAFARESEDEVLTAAFAPDGAMVAVGSWDRGVDVYDAATGSLVQRLEGHTAAVWDVSFAATGGLLATASDDGTVQLWTVSRPTPALEAPGQGYVWSVAFSPQGRTIATGSADRRARLYDATQGTLLHTLEGHRDTVGDVAFSPDGTLLATASFDSTVRVWEVGTAALRHTLAGHANFVRSVAFSPDGELLATGSYDQTVALWDPRTGTRLGTLRGPKARVKRIAFSPDGTTLATGGDEPTVHLWELRSRAVVREIKGDGELLTGFAFSHDGTCLAVVDASGSVRLFDLAAGRWGPRLRWDTQSVNTVSFSRDDHLVLTAGDGRRVVCWSRDEGRPRLVLETDQSVVALAVAPVGQALAVGDGETARIYPLETEAAFGPPVVLLQRASVAAGLSLEGFNLVPR